MQFTQRMKKYYTFNSKENGLKSCFQNSVDVPVSKSAIVKNVNKFSKNWKLLEIYKIEL